MTCQRMLSEHEEIGRSCLRLRQILDQDSLDLTRVTVAIFDLASKISAHVCRQRVSSEVADRGIAEGLAAPVTTSASDCDHDLPGDWNRYLRHWDPGRIVADPACFRQATSAIIGRITARIAAENVIAHAAAFPRPAFVQLH